MQTKIFNYKFEDVFQASQNALGKLDINIVKRDKIKKTIIAKSDTSIFSWGENIQIIFEIISFSKTKVTVESTSDVQLFTWGKNDKNEKDIITEITNSLK